MAWADLLFEVRAALIAQAAPTAKLELSGGLASKADTCFLALIPVFTGIVSNTDRSNADVLGMSPDLPGNSTFVFADSPGYFSEILPVIKHQFYCLPLL